MTQKSKQSKRLTVAQIVQEAGVSTTTVSKVLMYGWVGAYALSSVHTGHAAFTASGVPVLG